MQPRKLPEAFQRTVRGVFPGGAAWLASLPSLIAECERRWHLRIADEPFDLSYNYVAAALTVQGREVVVKIGVPRPELRNEISALRLYGGGAAVGLLDADEERGMLLLERLRPGAKLSALEDDEHATLVAAQVMRDLRRPLPARHTFPSAADWASGLGRLRRRFGGSTGPFGARVVGAAESRFRELLASGEPPALVHGDLHHFNILSATRRPWAAIDPKGLAAEPVYEVGALLRNPSPERYLNLGVQRRRVDLLAAELGVDKRRIIDWAVAQAVLSAWWHYEDAGPDAGNAARHAWEPALACAETLLRLE